MIKYFHNKYNIFIKFTKIISNEIVKWIEFLIRNIPGLTGILLRRLWYKFRFFNSYKFIIERNCEFIAPRNISFDRNINIGFSAFFAAHGGFIRIGSNTMFNSNVHINSSVGGLIEIGQNVLIGPNVVMRTAGHNFDNLEILIRKQGHIIKNIIIEDDVWISANVTILGGVTIGKGAIIGAGAVVTKNIPSMAIAIGVPAKIIKYRNNL